MKLLIVEDDQNKLRQLVNHIKGKWSESTIEEKRSYHSGLAEIMQNEYDAIILDMSMPTFEKSLREPGGRPKAFAGRDIMSQMEWKGISTPVIIVTQFESFGEGEDTISLSELRLQLEQLGDPNYIGTVYYNTAIEDWKEELEYCLSAVMNRRGEL